MEKVSKLAGLADLLDRVAELCSVPFGRLMQIGFGLTVVVLVVHLFVRLLACWRYGRRPRPVPWRWWDRALYSLLLLSIGGLAGTAFYAAARGESLHQWVLMGHVACSLLFVFVLALLALVWAPACRYQGRAEPAERKFRPLTKFLFFLLLAGGVVLSATILVAMLPVVEPASMLQLFALHRYAALATTIIALLHLYTVWAARLGII